MIVGQLVRFALVGVVNTATYYAGYLGLRIVAPYLVAHVLAFLLSTVGSFFLNCWFTYRTRPTWRKLLVFPLTTATNFVVTTAGVVGLVEGLHLDERFSPLLAASVAIPVTFVVSRLVLTDRGAAEETDHTPGGLTRVSASVAKSAFAAAFVLTLRRWCEVMVSAGLAAAVYVTTLAVRGVYPFGANTVVVHDLNNQYAAFLGYLQHAIPAPQALLFSWQADLGMNVFPLVAYYLSSPFNLFVLAVSDHHLPEIIAVIVAGKLATAAACMALFLRRCQAGPRPLVVAFSVAYASMTWAIFQASNQMWLDALYLLPLVLLAIERLLAEGRLLPLAATTAATMLVNYYTGGMVLLFAALYLCARYTAARTSPGLRDAVALGAGAVCAVAAGAATAGFLLVPSLYALQIRPNTGGPGTLPDVPLPWPDLVARLVGGTMEDSLRGSPHLAVGTTTLVFALTFFATRSVRPIERLGFACVTGFVVASCRVPALYLLWHGLDAPTGFPYRFGFVLSFLVVYLAYRAVLSAAGRPGAAMLMFAGGATIAGAAWAASHRPDLLTPVVLAWTVGAVTIASIAGVAYLVWRRHPSGRRMVVSLLAAVLVIDTAGAACLAAGQLVRVDRARWDLPGPAWRTAASAAAPRPNEFFRSDTLRWHSPNDSMRFGNFALTHYSSLTNGPLHVALHQLGFSDPVPYVRFNYQGSTLVTDAILGFRYVLSDRPLDRAGFTLVRHEPAAHPESGEAPLYEYMNANALPVGFFLPAGRPAEKSADPFAQQEALLGDPLLFTSACHAMPVASGGVLRMSATGVTLERSQGSAEASLRWTCWAIGERQLYLWRGGGLQTGDEIRLDAHSPIAYPTEQDRGLLDLGRRADAGFTVEITTSQRRIYLPRNPIQGLDIARFQRWATVTKKRSVTHAHHSLNSLTIDTADPTGGMFFVSVPSIPGWRATLDGTPIAIQPIAKAFIGVTLPPGRHRIVFHFRPPGLASGLLLSAIGLAFLSALALADRFARRRTTGPSSSAQHASA